MGAGLNQQTNSYMPPGEEDGGGSWTRKGMDEKRGLEATPLLDTKKRLGTRRRVLVTAGV